jgi:hypothetical protein
MPRVKIGPAPPDQRAHQNQYHASLGVERIDRPLPSGHGRGRIVKAACVRSTCQRYRRKPSKQRLELLPTAASCWAGFIEALASLHEKLKPERRFSATPSPARNSPFLGNGDRVGGESVRTWKVMACEGRGRCIDGTIQTAVRRAEQHPTHAGSVPAMAARMRSGARKTSEIVCHSGWTDRRIICHSAYVECKSSGTDSGRLNKHSRSS